MGQSVKKISMNIVAGIITAVICAGLFPILINFIPFITITLENGNTAAVPPAGIVAAALMGILIIVLHRKNIVRLWEGTESKISFKKKKRVHTLIKLHKNFQNLM